MKVPRSLSSLKKHRRLERNVAPMKFFLFILGPRWDRRLRVKVDPTSSIAVTCDCAHCSFGRLLKEVFHWTGRLSRRSAHTSAVFCWISWWNAEQMRRQVGRRGTPYWQHVLLVSTLAPRAPLKAARCSRNVKTGASQKNKNSSSSRWRWNAASQTLRGSPGRLW